MESLTEKGIFVKGAGFSVCTYVFEIPLRHQGEVSGRQIAPHVWNSVERSGAINYKASPYRSCFNMGTG